MLCPIIELW